MKKTIRCIFTLIFTLSFVLVFSACNGDGEARLGNKNSNKLEGTWLWTRDNDRELIITGNKLKFNYFEYSYETDGDAIHFQQTHPSRGFNGTMKYSFEGELLVLDLGDMDGYFYGQSGIVKLEKAKTNSR